LNNPRLKEPVTDNFPEKPADPVPHSGHLVKLKWVQGARRHRREKTESEDKRWIDFDSSTSGYIHIFSYLFDSNCANHPRSTKYSQTQPRPWIVLNLADKRSN